MEETSQIGMVCYVHIPDERHSMPSSKNGNVFLASEDCLQMESRWGEYSTTLVSIKLLAEAMQLFPNAAHFMLVSGRCLPVVHPSAIISWSDKHIEKSAIYHGTGTHFELVEGKIRLYESENPWPIKAQPLAKGEEMWYLRGGNVQKINFIQTHDQRWILNRGHAELVLGFEQMDELVSLDTAYSNANKYKF